MLDGPLDAVAAPWMWRVRALDLEADLIFSDTRVKVPPADLLHLRWEAPNARSIDFLQFEFAPGGLEAWARRVWPRMELLAERSGRSLREVRSKAWLC